MNRRDRNQPLPFFKLLYEWLSNPLTKMLVLFVVLAALFAAGVYIATNRDAGKLDDDTFVVPENDQLIHVPEEN